MFFKKDHRTLIQNALSKEEWSEAARHIQVAFDESNEEDLLAWCAGMGYELRIPGTEFAPAAFVDRFPDSLHLMRIFLAQMEVDQGRYDSGSNEARIHLRKLMDSGWPQQEPENPWVWRAISQGSLLLTAVYTDLGARSYALRVLNWAHPWLRESWIELYQKEEATLHQELKDSANQALDAKWEDFFNSGFKHMDELIKHCREHGAEAIAKRVELLEGKHRFDPDGAFQITEEEILMLVFRSGDAWGIM